jgi:hypothetical protein
MTQRKIRCTAVAASLAAVLTLAAPAHAASHARGTTGGSGWLDAVWHWVSGVWTSPSTPHHSQIPGLKSDKGLGIDPDGLTGTTQPANSTTDRGLGIDPDG